MLGGMALKGGASVGGMALKGAAGMLSCVWRPTCEVWFCFTVQYK